jgi:CheY-like chemotaxis protein
MSGAEVSRRLRQEFSSTELTLVAISGYPSDHPAFENTRFDHYLLKPVAFETLVSLLNSLTVESGEG